MLDPGDWMPSVRYDGFLLETSDTNIQYKSPQKILRETKFSNFNLALSKNLEFLVGKPWCKIFKIISIFIKFISKY